MTEWDHPASLGGQAITIEMPCMWTGCLVMRRDSVSSDLPLPCWFLPGRGFLLFTGIHYHHGCGVE